MTDWSDKSYSKTSKAKNPEKRVTWTSVGLPDLDPANPNNKLGIAFKIMQKLAKKKK